jgi:hypothetical protein
MLETPEGIAALQRHQPILHDLQNNKLLGMKTSEISETLTQIPPDSLKNMGVSEFLTNVFRIRKESDLVANYAAQATKLAKKGQPVPTEMARFGTKETLPTDSQGFQWREITDPNATLISASMLDNSIGNYSKYGTYGVYETGRKALDEGKVKLFTLYDPNNHIVTNVEYAVPDKNIAQMYAKKNVTPENYLPQMAALIQHLKAKTIPYAVKNALKDKQLYSEPRYKDREQDMYLNVVTPEGRKHGGLVERNTDDNRRYL